MKPAAHPQRANDADPLIQEPQFEELPVDEPRPEQFTAGDVAPADTTAEEIGEGPDRKAAAEEIVKSNPFPPAMTVPGRDGEPVTVELDAIDGVVFAPALDSLDLDPHIRQYVTQYCAAWSSSVLTTGKLQASYPFMDPPRRGQLIFTETQLHAMLGLGSDESLVSIIVDPVQMLLRFVVDSPRLAPKQWSCEPPIIGLPISAWYEGRQGAGDSRGAAAAQRQLDILRARQAASAQEWAHAVEEAQRRLTAAQQDRQARS